MAAIHLDTEKLRSPHVQPDPVRPYQPEKTTVRDGYITFTEQMKSNSTSECPSRYLSIIYEDADILPDGRTTHVWVDIDDVAIRLCIIG